MPIKKCSSGNKTDFMFGFIDLNLLHSRFYNRYTKVTKTEGREVKMSFTITKAIKQKAVLVFVPEQPLYRFTNVFY
ncbi:hypothetical protein D3C87_1842020 [compost metagenome]